VKHLSVFFYRMAKYAPVERNFDGIKAFVFLDNGFCGLITLNVHVSMNEDHDLEAEITYVSVEFGPELVSNFEYVIDNEISGNIRIYAKTKHTGIQISESTIEKALQTISR
jgi:hypothetical protein